jgi:predicted transcriptional regulator
MTPPVVALLSVRSPHIERILDGSKTVEVRRRPMRVAPGTRVLLYAAGQRRELVGSFKTGPLETGSPDDIWQRFRERLGLSESDFFEYFLGATSSFAIPAIDVRVLDKPVSLSDLRQRWPAFSTPRTHRYVQATELHSLLNGERAHLLPETRALHGTRWSIS